MSDENKKAIEIALDNVKWEPTGLSKKDEEELPVVTYTGVLTGDISITVVRLSNGMRIIPKEELLKLGIAFKEDL